MIRKSLGLLFFSAALTLLSFAQEKQKGAPTEPVKLIRGPYLQVASSTGILIRWRTDVSSRSKVSYGTKPGKLDQATADHALVTEHQIQLKGLLPSTRYYYAIGGLKDTLQGNQDNYFTTLPEAGKTGHFRIAALGDCGDNSINQRRVKEQVIKYIGKDELTAWILLGDNAYSDGTDSEFQSKFFNIYKDDLLKKYPLFPAPGNHDYHDTDLSAKHAQETHETAYYQNFSMPVNGESGGTPSHTQAFYSFDIGNIHFLSLDSYGKEEQTYRLYDTLGPQVNWIKKDLAANKNKGWVIAFWHHPPYTMGSHNSDQEEELVKIRENFIRIIEREGVDLVLNGHSHDYERSRMMQGHYGPASSFNPKIHNLSTSSGRNDGSKDSAPYQKDPANNKGTVYVVSGSAGKLGGKQTTYPHNAMYFSDADHGGASILEIEGNRLELKWVCADGEIRDQFTIEKKAAKGHVPE
ncbi:purple acid phosphatase family protein [Pedobacter lusitanus]|uniref:purple acid phosphatase family protein n=1 Tax=Pedobacter lusitanus TaxID=1503925 RepID=UPI000698B71A|nr:metallophosphoesterase family protein [Pedobacter lusitanus]